MLCVKDQPQRRDGAGMDAQQLIELVRLAKAQAGSADKLGDHRGLEALVLPDQQQVKHGLLPVAEKQIFAEGLRRAGPAQLRFHGGKLLHAGSGRVLRLAEGNIQAPQQPIDLVGISPIHKNYLPKWKN